MEKAPLVVIALWLLVFSSGKTIADTKVNNDAKDYIVATVDGTTITNSTVINFYKRLPVQYRTTSFENLFDSIFCFSIFTFASFFCSEILCSAKLIASFISLSN